MARLSPQRGLSRPKKRNQRDHSRIADSHRRFALTVGISSAGNASSAKNLPRSGLLNEWFVAFRNIRRSPAENSRRRVLRKMSIHLRMREDA